MKPKFWIVAAVAALLPMSAFAGDISINDAYARAGSPMAKAGAAFMEIVNGGTEDDRLVAASTDVAMKVELHTHVMDGGVMQMREVEGGFVIPAGGSHMLERGADHVMMMGLKQALEHGKEITLTLVFEKSGPMTIVVPIDLERGN
jgi:copper(I)-binding protein